MSRAKITRQAVFGVLPLTLGNKHDLMSTNGRQPRGHRAIVAIKPITVQLDKVLAHVLDVMRSQRPARMTRDLHTLP